MTEQEHCSRCGKPLYEGFATRWHREPYGYFSLCRNCDREAESFVAADRLVKAGLA